MDNQFTVSQPDLSSAPGKKRNYGVETLRIVSMFLVCVLHVLGQGGVLGAAVSQSVNYYTAWFLEITAYCAVNCYALISGYVGVNSKFKLANVVALWIQVLFYSLLIFAVFTVAKIEPFSGETLLHSFLPVTFEEYWFFTAYFGMYLLVPLLNAALAHIPKKQMGFLLTIILAIVFIFTRFNGDLFQLNQGYSVLWLVIMYLAGGYIKKYQPFRKWKTWALVLSWVGAIVLTWVVKLAMEQIALGMGAEPDGNVLVGYTSPTVTIVAVAMLELFSRIPFEKKPKLLPAMAASSFGVYLIHVHPFMWKYLKDVFVRYASYHPALLFLAVLGTAAALYVGCCGVDYLRSLLFKAIRLKEGLTKLENKFRDKYFTPDPTEETKGS